jgi:hypothetical protein
MFGMPVHVPFQLPPGFLARTRRIRDVFCDVGVAIQRPERVQIIDHRMPEKKPVRFDDDRL